MLELLNGFIAELREAGLPVSLTENLDAMEAVKHIPLEDRVAFKYALAATLVKNNAHWRSFETVFEVYFSLRGREYAIGDAELSDLPDDLLDAMEQMQGQGQGDGQMQGGGGGDAAQPRGARRDALPVAAAGRRRDDARRGPPVGAAVRRHGAGPTGRRHVLPVPHAAEPRPRRRVGEADRAGPTERRPAVDAARGAARARRVRRPHQPAEAGDRGRDPPTAGRRPRGGGDGEDAAQAAARGHRLHARLAATR